MIRLCWIWLCLYRLDYAVSDSDQFALAVPDSETLNLPWPEPLDLLVMDGLYLVV